MPDPPHLPSRDAEVPETRYPSFASMGHVLLPDTPGEEAGPPTRPSSPEVPAGRSGRCLIFGEIARGGMGAVLRGRDPELGRELVIKVLLEGHKGNPDLVRRFVEEAQIAGQLQHPGIAPIYDVGTFPDGRPYFAMKLVKGRTLAALLKERSSPLADLDRFLATFEAMAQTLAYAHSRGVIHRDLKPSNVMVGGFGEVQVMDWGLAKVRAEGGALDDRTVEASPEETVIATARSGSDSDASTAGSVLGTPAYMSPEQAVGELDRVDRRADVFGLGAILCEILTGQYPHRGRDAAEVLRRAIRGDISDVIARLGAEGIDPGLAALARDCLAPEPADRPVHAGEVATRMTAYFAGVRERLRAADLDRARAEARALEERKRRKLQLGLAASILGLVALGGGVWSWDRGQRADRALRTTLAVDEVLARAANLRADARAAPDRPERWAEALAVVGQAEALVEQARADAPLRTRVAALARTLRDERAQAQERARRAEVERALLADLEGVRGGRADHLDWKRTDIEYAAAFRKAGLNLDAVDPKAAGTWIADHARPAELASFLDDWADVRSSLGAEAVSWGRLVNAARAADPDPWRDALRARTLTQDARDIDEFRRLADDPGALEAQPTTSLVLLALRLKTCAGDPKRAERVLSQAWRRDPGNFWVNLDLAQLTYPLADDGPRRDRPEEALRYWSVAVAVRPRSAAVHANFGSIMRRLGRLDEAVMSFREAVRLKPDLAAARSMLAFTLRDQGKLDEAVATIREVIGLGPDDATNRAILGLLLSEMGRFEESRVELQRVRRSPRINANTADEIDQLLTKIDRWRALGPRLATVLQAGGRPADAEESLAMAEICRIKGLFAAAARLWADAFAMDPGLCRDCRDANRYNAACAAALAGRGKGKDDPPPDDAARASLRGQALGWLKAELATWSGVVEGGTPEGRADASETLRHWHEDADLAGVREAGSLAQLPEAEREGWQALWAEVDALLAKAEAGRP